MIHKETKKYGQFVILMFLFIIIFQFTSYASEMITYNENNYFNIVIPKEITINAETESANYYIKVNGNILDTQMLSIVPDTNFLMQENGGKNDINGIVTQNNFDYYYNDLQGEGTEYNGNIQIYNLSAGEWSGKFNFNISVNTHEHSYKFISETEATCTEDGYKKYKCEVCEYIYKEKTVNATGHNYTSVYTSPTEIEKGYTTYTCQNCGDSYIIYDENISEHTHNYNSEVTIAPTCTSDGQITYTCSDCNNTYTDVISAIGHNYTSEITKEPTCTESGLMTYTCQNCGDTYIETITATGHNYNSGVITKEPTCTETGLKTYTCQNCGDIYTEPITATGHNYIGVLTKEATETENGEMTYTCSQCGDIYIESLPTKDTFNNMSWFDISTVSEAGEAANYFNVGDEKELTIGSETYHVQILGFAHDDKSDGTGKTGITVGLKEVMTTPAKIKDTNTNVGGWKDSKIRTYVNNDVYNALPSDLQTVVKPVDKKTSEGNKSTNVTITSDKLFLLSEVEIFGKVKYSANGEGSQYQYFTDGGSKIKYKSGSSYWWWERSPNVNGNYNCCNVSRNGDANSSNASNSNGVVFGFSI